MAATLTCFQQALLSPAFGFRTLRNFEVMITTEGLPALHRTSRFVEAELRIDGAHYLLAMPLTWAIEQQSEPILRRIQTLRYDFVAPVTLLPGELCAQECGNAQPITLVLQALPGVPLLEGAARLTLNERLEALNTLEQEMRRHHFAHNNLKEENLRMVGRRLVLIRCFDATTNGSTEADARAFEQLRTWLGATPTPSPCEPTTRAQATDQPSSHPDRRRGYASEGLICFEQASKFGYMDTAGRVVIEPCFRRADDFHENRAVVEGEKGTGVIDREGHYILPACYKAIDYDIARSRFHVTRNDRQAWFDYLGEQLTDWEPIHNTTPCFSNDNKQNKTIALWNM